MYLYRISFNILIFFSNFQPTAFGSGDGQTIHFVYMQSIIMLLIV